MAQEMGGEVRDDDLGLAWQTDITAMFFKAQAGATRYRLVCPRGLKDFVDVADSSKLILVGAKGTGKSLALCHKAVALSAKDSGFLLATSSYPYICRLQGWIGVEDQRGMAQFSNTRQWIQVWKLIIGGILAIRFLREDPTLGDREATIKGKLCNSSEEYRNVFFSSLLEFYPPGATGGFVERALDFLIGRKIDSQICARWFNEVISPILGKLPESVKLAIFIDSFDELPAGKEGLSVGQATNDANANREQTVTDGSLFAIWATAQCALIDAALDILYVSQGRARLYASVREEAYEWYRRAGTRALAQVDDVLVHLKYDRAQLREIFEANIELTPPSLYAQTHGSLEEKFFGSQDQWHPRIWQQEGLIEWVIRHTFLRPREVVWIGRALTRLGPTTRRDKHMSGACINQMGTRIFDDYASYLIPRLDEKALRALAKAKSNILLREEAEAIDNTDAARWGIAKPLTYLYNCGLIGVPRRKSHERDDEWEMRFAGEAADITRYRSLPSSVQYYALHPCLHSKLRNDFPSNCYDLCTRFIVGQGLTCPQRLDPQKITVVLGTQADPISIQCIKDGSSELHTLGETTREILLLGILCALASTGRSRVTPEEVCTQIKHLRTLGWIPRVIGRPQNNEVAEDHMAKELERGHNAGPVKALFENPATCEIIKLTKRKVRGELSFGIDDIKPSEIWIR